MYVSCLVLYHFGGLVCTLLLRRLKGYSPKSALTEEQVASQLERNLLEGHQSRGAENAIRPEFYHIPCLGDKLTIYLRYQECYVLQCAAVCCSVCCSVLQTPKQVETKTNTCTSISMLQCDAACCDKTSWDKDYFVYAYRYFISVSTCFGVCNTLQHAATRCNTLQHTDTHTHSSPKKTRSTSWVCARMCRCVFVLQIILDLPFGFPISNIISLCVRLYIYVYVCVHRRMRSELKWLRLPKYQTSFHRSPRNFQTNFQGILQNLKQIFSRVNGSPSHSIDCTGKL